MPANNNPYGGPSYSFYKRGQTDAGVPTYDFFKGEEDEAPSLTLPQGGYADQFITKIPERNEPDMRLAQNGSSASGAATSAPPKNYSDPNDEPPPAATPAAPRSTAPVTAATSAPPKNYSDPNDPPPSAPPPAAAKPTPGGGGGAPPPWRPAPAAAPAAPPPGPLDDPFNKNLDAVQTRGESSTQESGTRRVLSPGSEAEYQDKVARKQEELEKLQLREGAVSFLQDQARQAELQKIPVERQYDARERALEAERQKRVDEIEKELEQERLKSKNPNDFWDSRDTKSSIALGIGMALGAFGTRPGEENQGTRVLNDAMNRHMRNREETVRKLYEKRGRTRENYADMQARLEAERRQALKQIQYQVADFVLQSENPRVRAAAKKQIRDEINANTDLREMVRRDASSAPPAGAEGEANVASKMAPDPRLKMDVPPAGSTAAAPSGGAPGGPSTAAARDLLGKAGAGIAKGAAAAKDTVSKYGNKAIDKLLDSDLSVLDPPPPGTPDKYGLLSPEGRLKQAEQDDRAALEYQRDYVMQRQRRGDAPPGPGELPEPSEKVTRRVYEIGKAQQAALDAVNKPARPPAPPPTLQNKRDAVLIDQLGAARAATGGLPPGTPPTRNSTPNIPQVAQPVDAGMMQSRPEAPGQLTRSTPAPFVDARKEALQDLRRFNQEGIDYREGRRKEPPKPMKEEYIKELFSGQKPEAPAKGRKPPTEQNKRDKVLIDKELEAQRKKDAATFKEVLQKRKDIAVKLRRRDIAPKERATMETLDKQLGDLQKLMEKPATMERSKEPSKADSVLNEWRKQAR